MDGRTIGRLTEVITCGGVAPTVRAASSASEPTLRSAEEI